MLAITPLSPGPSAPAGAQAADLRHVEDWIFDLDNTLYEARESVLGVVEMRICRFVERHCGLPEAEAFALQKNYFRRYGNTLAGLMAHHAADPEDYLSFVNDVDVGVLVPDPRLAGALERLPGRRFVFTNNCGRYAERVLRHLGISHLFEDVWDIRTTEFAPKPDPKAYQTIVARGMVRPENTAFFEDMACNLAPAHALGMTTICIAPQGTPRETHVHHYTDDLPQFLSAIEVVTSP